MPKFQNLCGFAGREKIDISKFSIIVTEMKFRKMFAVSAAILLALIFFASTSKSSLAQDPKCGLLQDCTFDEFYGDFGACSGVWQCDAPQNLQLTEGEGWPKGPSLTFRGDAPFQRKVFQRVAVTPGKGYRFSCPFCVVNVNGNGWHEGDEVNRKLGIDPFGGTDPNSGNIKWSNDFFGKGRFDDDQLTVSEYARADHITVFIWVINPYEGKHIDVFVDTPGLVENPDMPPIQVSAPTVTPPPPPPTNLPPTAKPTVAPKPTQEPAATDVPPPTAEPTEEPTQAPEPSTQAQATDAPRATRTRVAQVQPTTRPARTRVAIAENGSSAETNALQNSALPLGIVGLFGIVGVTGGIVLLGAAAFLLLRRK